MHLKLLFSGEFELFVFHFPFKAKCWVNHTNFVISNSQNVAVANSSDFRYFKL